MASSLDPMVLGPLMIAFTMVWFALMAWSARDAADHGEPTSSRRTEHGKRLPWWRHDRFSGS
jgi:hypothetical protein